MSRITKFLQGRIASFRPVYAGLQYVLRTQPNIWVHATITIVVLVLGFWLELGRRDWVLILLTVGMVWLAEFFNTAVEVIIDLVSPGRHKLAKAAKDIGAAAVAIAALLAVLIGILVLGPPLRAVFAQ